MIPYIAEELVKNSKSGELNFTVEGKPYTVDEAILNPEFVSVIVVHEPVGKLVMDGLRIQ